VAAVCVCVCVCELQPRAFWEWQQAATEVCCSTCKACTNFTDWQQAAATGACRSSTCKACTSLTHHALGTLWEQGRCHERAMGPTPKTCGTTLYSVAAAQCGAADACIIEKSKCAARRLSSLRSPIALGCHSLLTARRATVQPRVTENTNQNPWLACTHKCSCDDSSIDCGNHTRCALPRHHTMSDAPARSAASTVPQAV
jgi:hypothetical protein